MAGDNRRVDSGVLRDLAGVTREKRDRLDSLYRECRSRVDAAPRRWNTGEWDGTLTFMRLELEQMDREQQELVDRAWKNDILSAVANLPDPLPLAAWKFLLAAVAPVGLVLGAISGAARDLVATVARFVSDFARTEGRKPTAAEISKGTGTITKTAASTSPVTVPVAGLNETTTKFFEKYKGQQVPDLAGGYVGECVSLAKRWSKEAYGIELGAFNGGPDGSWKTNAGFDLTKWEKIPQGTGSYQIGDLVFFPAAKANGWYGHIGVVASVPDATGHFRIIEQNYTYPDPKGPVQNTRVVDQTTSLGVMRRR
jgi:surface antigen